MTTQHTPLTPGELDLLRALHASPRHGKAGCKVCRLLATLDDVHQTVVSAPGLPEAAERVKERIHG